MSCENKTVVITGANSGIGKQLALQYAHLKANVILACRCPEKALSTIKEIQHQVPTSNLEFIHLDLSSFQSVERFAHSIKTRKIDVLVLNAGINIPRKIIKTKDDCEVQFQVNYLSNFLITNVLLGSVLGSDLKKIIYIGSSTHKLASFKNNFILKCWHLYAVSKLSAHSFFWMLQELYSELDVFIISPGPVQTNINKHKNRLVQMLYRMSNIQTSPEKTVKNILSITTENPKKSVYWYKGKSSRLSKKCTDRKEAASLWNNTIQLLQNRLSKECAQDYVNIQNYPKTFESFGPRILTPSSVKEISDIVKAAQKQGKKIRVIGSMCSYNDIFLSKDCMVQLSNFNKVINLDRKKNIITCQPGITINQLCDYLDAQSYTLRFAGNFGQQTLAGAIATGTHGYYRDGGVLGELVTSLKVVNSSGIECIVNSESELRAFRINLGALGIITEIAIEIDLKDQLCRYEVKNVEYFEFLKILKNASFSNDYFRFFVNFIDQSYVTVLLINKLKETVAEDKYDFISKESGLPKLIIGFLRFLLKTYFIKFILKKLVPVKKQKFSIITQFSSYLFTKAGIVKKEISYLARIGYEIVYRYHSNSMEFGLPLEDYDSFHKKYMEISSIYKDRSPDFDPHYVCRYTGKSNKVILAPNYDRDVLFIDVNVPNNHPCSSPFLKDMEKAMIQRHSIRFHFGKSFSSSHDTISLQYPRENIDIFKEIKNKYDPHGVFSNEYTQRVLNI